MNSALLLNVVEARNGGDVVEAARELEAACFLGAFGESREDLARTYDCYEDQTLFVALQLEGALAAACRIVLPSGDRSLPTLRDSVSQPFAVDKEAFLGRIGVAEDQIMDLATMSTLPAHRARGLAAFGLAASVEVARALDLGVIVAMVDVNVGSYFSRNGVEFSAIRSVFPQSYLGSEQSLPVWIRTRDLGLQASRWMTSLDWSAGRESFANQVDELREQVRAAKLA